MVTIFLNRLVKIGHWKFWRFFGALIVNCFKTEHVTGTWNLSSVKPLQCRYVKLRCDRQPYLNLCYRIDAQMAQLVHRTQGVANVGQGDTIVVHLADSLFAASIVCIVALKDIYAVQQ